MRSLIVALIIHCTLNILFFLKSMYVFKGNKPIRALLIILFSAEFLIYVFGFFFYHHLPAHFVHFIRMKGTSWMLFVIYAGSLIFLIDFVYLIVKRSLHSPKMLLQQTPKTQKIIWSFSVLSVIAILFFGNYKFKNPTVNEVDVQIEKSGGRHSALRIVFAADMHLGYLINKDYVRKYVDLIMAQNPDLILFGGDLLDSDIQPIENGGMDVELKRLHAPLGVYACTGNHEYRFEAEKKIQWLNDAGITVLRDTAVLIDSVFYVVGREDFIIEDRMNLSDLLQKQQVDFSKPIIVLNHTPNNLQEEVSAGADIALYGHTHHGQAFPGNVATQLAFEHAYGHLKKGHTHIYVTSGIGLVGPQYRVGTVSEIALLQVKFSNK